MVFDCRSGERGLCTVDIFEVAGTIDHKDVFLSERQKVENTKMCVCVSQVAGSGVMIDTSYRKE